MKRKLGVVGLVVAVLAVAMVLWRCSAGSHDKSNARAATKNVASTTAASHGDPRKLERASIAGTVTDEDKAVVPRARVCANLSTREISAELLREPRCTTADDRGRYALGELYTGKYAVVAAAKPYRPGAFHPGGDRKETSFQLAAGEKKTGVDIVLRKGGVEITGTVSDVTGGPVAHALVSASSGWWSNDDEAPPAETDADGKFSLWVKPGNINVVATAEGYAAGNDSGSAPGSFEILLTPESSLSGTVVDAKSGEPVAGVPVTVAEGEWFSWGERGSPSDITDEKGTFRVTRLQPGRYIANARSPHGFGRSDGSTLVGLGQHVEGVVVKLHPGYQVSGKIVLPDKTTCKKGSFGLHDKITERGAYAMREPDGTLHADGVLPGMYHVNVECEGYHEREHYAAIEVKDKDVTGLVWEVDVGATVRGRVVTKSGAPVEDAEISARTIGGKARAKTDWGSETSDKDGTYKLEGLDAGTYKLYVSHDKLVGEKDGWKVETRAGATVDKDLVLDDGGSVKGIVVDAQGKAVSGVQVSANASGGGFWNGGVRTAADGTFTIDGLRAGDYRVTANRGWWSDTLRKPGSTDDEKQGEKVTVAAGKTANVKLVVEAQSGVITGTVIDTEGKPVSDAFVSAARESDAAGARASSVERTRWTWDEKPVVSGVDGTFKLDKLSPGKYTLRAYRKGGGEAVAEHVAIGGSAKLQIHATGSIEGIVKRPGGKLEELEVSLEDAKTGLSRHETFFRTDGKFAIRDLPAGHFTLTADAAGGKKQVTIDLGEGEHKTGVEVQLDELVSIVGRIVDYTTKQPVVGMRMFAAIGKQGNSFSFRGDDDEQPNISDDDGRFTIEQAPRGPVTIRGFPKDFGESDYGWVNVVREISGNGTIDVGDLPVLKRRLKRGDTAGELGIKFVDQPPDTDNDKRQFKVSYIDPKGPAAKTELKVGDVLTSVDGIDVTGGNYTNGWLLMRAAPGTTLKLGLSRGVTVTIVLAQP